MQQEHLVQEIYQRIATELNEPSLKQQPKETRSAYTIVRTLHWKHKRKHVRQMQRFLMHVKTQLNMPTITNGQECVICYELMEPKQFNLRQLPCGHVYHSECINQWAIYQRTCPYDRITFDR